MTDITLGVTTDYTALDVHNVHHLTFTNIVRGPAVTATFLAAQLYFDISADAGLVVTGSAGRNHLVVEADPTFATDLYIYNFSKWTALDSVTLNGHDNAENLKGAQVATLINAGAGNDTVTGMSGLDTLFGGDGNDRMSSKGGVVDAGAGDDQITALAGSIDGGVGSDRFVQYVQAFTGALSLNLQDGGGGRDIGAATGLTLKGIEQVSIFASTFDDVATGGNLRDMLWGLEGNDSLKGMGGNDYLSGGSGDDTLSGGAGADALIGGAGADRLLGGAGADRFVFQDLFDSANATPDLIVDFVQGQDKIDFSTLADSLALGPHGPLRFVGLADFLVHFDGANFSLGYEVRYEKSAGETLVEVGYGDLEGNTYTSTIHLTGLYNLTINDFIF